MFEFIGHSLLSHGLTGRHKRGPLPPFIHQHQQGCHISLRPGRYPSIADAVWTLAYLQGTHFLGWLLESFPCDTLNSITNCIPFCSALFIYILCFMTHTLPASPPHQVYGVRVPYNKCAVGTSEWDLKTFTASMKTGKQATILHFMY